MVLVKHQNKENHPKSHKIIEMACLPRVRCYYMVLVPFRTNIDVFTMFRSFFLCFYITFWFQNVILMSKNMRNGITERYTECQKSQKSTEGPNFFSCVDLSTLRPPNRHFMVFLTIWESLHRLQVLRDIAWVMYIAKIHPKAGCGPGATGFVNFRRRFDPQDVKMPLLEICLS